MIKDTENFFRNTIENILVTASWVERVKHLTGLKAVSQIWGQKPAWYFWVKNMSGAYSLQLEKSATEKRDDLNWHNGNFSIKYYPHPQEEVFTDLFVSGAVLCAKRVFRPDPYTPLRRQRKDTRNAF